MWVTEIMIFEYITSAIFLGLIVAIPPGSVTVIACQRALQFGFRNSLFFSLGSGISDVFYIVLVYFGVANVIANNPDYTIILWVICGIILLIVGISSITSTLRDNGYENHKGTLKKGFLPTFLSGILITLTNPMTIVGWLGIAGNFFLIWNIKMPETRAFPGLTVFLIMFGVYLWFVPMIIVVSRIGKMFSDKVKKILITGSGCILVVFGLSAFYYAATMVR